MTTLIFPDLTTLQVAITSGVVPEAISCTPARTAMTKEGKIAVDTPVRFPQRAIKELQALGVTFSKARRVTAAKQWNASCWLQLLPLRSEGTDGDLAEGAVVMFEFDRERQFIDVVTEILRLGNSRQSFRCVTDDAHPRILLQVVGPPYYSLLRVHDRANDGPTPRAYLQRGNRVWVQLGFTHQLVERIIPAPGQMVLLSPPCQWTYLQEAPFRDIYEVLEFSLPQGREIWSDAGLPDRIRVPLRLAAGNSTEPSELWVLEQDAIAQLDSMVSEADDQLLARLAFAVGERKGKAIVVLRSRPSKELPPVLVLRGAAYRTYLKLPNLFLPVGQRLYPPLRREAVARLLGSEREQVTWLAPTERGGFQVRSLPDSAFRPLSDWVDYVVDREGEPLQAWIASTRFDFAGFRLLEENPPQVHAVQSKQPPVADRTVAKLLRKKKACAPQAKPTEDSPDRTVTTDTSIHAPEPSQAKPPHELEQRLRELEAQFNALELSPDAQELRPLWREMACANAALAYRRDATVCWSNVFWEDQHPNLEDLRAWLRDEERHTEGPRLLDGALQETLRNAEARPINAAALAAFLVWNGRRENPSAELVQNLGAVAAHLERLELNLPIRAAWMAWHALARLSGGDVLVLAKARDRTLERLFHQGLRPEFDLPTFLQSIGKDDGERMRVVRQYLDDLRKSVHRWLSKAPAAEGETSAYGDLLFAYAQARVGETQKAGETLASAEKILLNRDDIHRWLYQAFAARIQAARESRTVSGPLPEGLLLQLKSMDPAESYKIEKLRTESRILEPFEKFDPYRRYVERYGDELGRRLLGLIDQTDHDQLQAEARAILCEYGPNVGSPDLARALTVILQIAPRLGESFARESLEFVSVALKTELDLPVRALLLERGILLAAHFDQTDCVQSLVDSFHQLLARSNPKTLADAFDSLLTHSFRSLRKLGMRDAIDALFRQVTEILRHGADPGRRSGNSWFSLEVSKVEGDLPRSKELMQIGKILLQVAHGWFYYGEHDQARELLDEVRGALFQAKLAEFPRMKLASAYLGALGLAPVDFAVKRIDEVFRGLPRGESRYAATMTHFGVLELNVLEAAILALVGDHQHLDARVRRWLDEDEFVVRRRLHRDMREALAREGAA